MLGEYLICLGILIVSTSYGFNMKLKLRRNIAGEYFGCKILQSQSSNLAGTMETEASLKGKLISACDMICELDERQLCDIELLMQGGFSPLDSYMNEDVYISVVNEMKLKNGEIFGLPVVYDTNDESIVPGKKVLLCHKDIPIATLYVTSTYIPNKVLEAQRCYGTTSIEHPAVAMITMERGKYYCGGKITGLNVPVREFPCRTPAQVRSELPVGVDVIAFQCRNPIHRAHYELFMRALEDPLVRPNAVVLVHPTCGPTQPDDIPGAVRYKTYEVLRQQIQNPRVLWAYLPYSMHMAGPREAVQHMIIRRNYGCTHFIIGRDMAGCKSSLTGEFTINSHQMTDLILIKLNYYFSSLGEDFYGPYEAQEFALKHAAEIGVTPVPSLNLVYTAEEVGLRCGGLLCAMHKI